MPRLPLRHRISNYIGKGRAPVEMDWPLAVLALLLALYGILVIYSLTLGDPRTHGTAYKQMVWVVLGVTAAGTCFFVDYRSVVRMAPWIYGVIFIVLLITLSIGRHSHGAQSWIALPGIPFRIQPSEFSKLAVVILLTYLYTLAGQGVRRLSHILIALVFVLPMTLLILKQPDLGTTMTFVPMVLGMTYLAGLPGYYFLFILPLGLGLFRPILCDPRLDYHIPFWTLPLVWAVSFTAISAFAWRRRMVRIDLLILILLCGGGYLASARVWDSLKSYQQMRVLTFLDPEKDPQRSAYHVRQAQIALGSGGLTGKGWAQGTQSGLRFLPEYQTDFVFSALGEQWGFAGTASLLLLYALLLWRGFAIASDARRPDGSLLAAGLVLYLGVHVMINIGICLRLLPITGLPLSFMSYGGSATLANFTAIGLLLSIRARKYLE